MSIKISGTAEFKSLTTGNTVFVKADELEFDTVAADERGMGTQLMWSATVEPEDEKGSIEWIITEYPSNSLNDVSHQLQNFELIKDFAFDITDDEEYPDEEE